MNEQRPEMDLRNHFLISMPHLNDGHFNQTLTYICDHSAQGAMGIVINRPLSVALKDVLEHLELDTSAMTASSPYYKSQVYNGGPVQEERGFVLHSPTTQEWQSSVLMSDQLQLTTSLDVLEAIGAGVGPSQFLVALGYAGWGAGQLEEEIKANSWLSCSADANIIFELDADQRLNAAAAKLGVNLDLLSSQSGHA